VDRSIDASRVTPEMIAALDALLEFAVKTPRRVYPTAEEMRVVDAINILDNADYFVPISDKRDELGMD
jgi:hypothetical protein